MATEIYLGNPPENIVKWIKAEAERKYQEMLKTPLHFTANEPGANVLLKTSDGSSWCEFVYSTDEMKTWNDYHVNTDIIQLDDCKNRTVYLKAKYPIEVNDFQEPQNTPNRYGLCNYPNGGNSYHNFIINGQVKANGNIQFLIDRDGIFDEAYDYAFTNLFENCKSLIEAPLILPAQYVYNCSYQRMFSNCTSLVKGPSKILNYKTAPELYREMFLNCQSLETVPLLTYDTSDEYAEAIFFDMFRNCTSLKDVSGLRSSKQLFPDNTKIGRDVCRGMFHGCSSLVTVPSNFLNGIIDASEYSDGQWGGEFEDAHGCFANMFAYCTSLDFPNDELYVNVENPRSYCFAEMFLNCESLTKPLRVQCGNYSENCFANMYRNCTSLTYAKLPNDSITEIPDYCFIGTFENCYSLSEMYSHIPASTSNSCYSYMLASCKSPFTMNNTFDEVAELIENNSLLGDGWLDENGDYVTPIEIICSDKTMLATYEYYGWTLTEK